MLKILERPLTLAGVVIGIVTGVGSLVVAIMQFPSSKTIVSNTSESLSDDGLDQYRKTQDILISEETVERAEPIVNLVKNKGYLVSFDDAWGGPTRVCWGAAVRVQNVSNHSITITLAQLYTENDSQPTLLKPQQSRLFDFPRDDEDFGPQDWIVSDPNHKNNILAGIAIRNCDAYEISWDQIMLNSQ